MITNENCEIKIWNFQQGRFKFNTYNEHRNPIYCLAYSKRANNFISGGGLQEIICWQQMNQKEWQCSQTFKLPSNDVQCLILNKQEDQLISGGFDHEIIVWKVDFMENNLTFLNSLNKNSNRIHLVLIKLKLLGLEGKWKFKYKQSVQYGNKIYFINDQQFLWVTRDKQINDILVFELENGVFKQNSNKTITLNKNNECDDNSYFPIKNHKDRNVILAKYQHHIDLIMQQWIIFCIFEQKRKKYSFYPMRYFKIE